METRRRAGKRMGSGRRGRSLRVCTSGRWAGKRGSREGQLGQSGQGWRTGLALQEQVTEARLKKRFGKYRTGA